MENRFDDDLLLILAAGGWNPGRRVNLPPLPQDYPVFAAALEVLKEFGGLHIGTVGKGRNCATSDVSYHPLEAEGLSHHTGLKAPNGLRIYPLGEVHHRHGCLFIDEEGRIYLWFDELEFFASSHDDALRRLLRGEK